MEQESKLAEQGDHELATKQNRGRFRPGDPRINRLGRRLKRVPTLAERVEAWDGKGPCPVCHQDPPPQGGKLMQESTSEKALRYCLANGLNLPYVLTLPEDARIVAIKLDSAGAVVVTYRSEQFRPVPVGGPIPTLMRHHFGQRSRSW